MAAPDLAREAAGRRMFRRRAAVHRHAVRLAGLLALLALPRPAPLAGQSAGDREAEVAAIRFQGRTIFDRTLLHTAIASQSSRCRLPTPLSWVTCSFGVLREPHAFDGQTLRDDAVRLQLFYYQRGYRATKIETDTVRGASGLEIIFRIDPGEPVRVGSIEVDGAAEILPDDIARQLQLRPGEPFNLLAYEASRDSLISALKNRGYARADALAGYDLPRGAAEATVRYEVIPGTLTRFGEIEILGADRVSPAVVERMLAFRTGDLYRQSEILRSQSNLFTLDVFRHASVQARLDQGPDSVVPIRVQVNEGDINRVRVGAGVNEADCVTAEGRWTNRNFSGGARRLEIRGAVSNVLAGGLGGKFPCKETSPDTIYRQLNGSLAADFLQPWFFGPRNTLGAGIFIERRSVPEVFVRNARGGHIAVTRQLSPRTSVSLSYRPELTSLEAEGLFFCTSFVVCTEEDIQVLSDPHWLAPLNLAFARDRSNALFSPTRGYIARLEAEQAGAFFGSDLGSDFAYLRLIGELSAYRGLTDGVVLAAHLRPGWARPLRNDRGLGLNPQRRFFAGGPNSVRGFAQYRLGPKVLRIEGTTLLNSSGTGGIGCTMAEVNAGTCDAGPLAADSADLFEPRPVGGAVLLEGSLELRFPITPERWRAAAFLDFGQVWTSHDAVSLDNIVVSPGVGVRFNSPIGPIRVDVGYNGQGGERLPVITNQVAADSTGIVDTGRLQALERSVFWDPRQSFFERLQVHFSIGQAF